MVLAPKRRRDTAGVDGVCGSLAVAALMCGRSGKVALAVPQVNFLNSLRTRIMTRVRPRCQRAGKKKTHWRIVLF